MGLFTLFAAYYVYSIIDKYLDNKYSLECQKVEKTQLLEHKTNEVQELRERIEVLESALIDKDDRGEL